MFILDTNVVSELRKATVGKADPGVVVWASEVAPSEQFISVVTVQELEIGVRLAERRDSVQGRALRLWLEGQVLPTFEGRILPVNTEVARCSAGLHVPDPRPVRDALIAATAIVHHMTVATRNLTDFTPTGAPTHNPWT